jgi:predicted AlkP superfamily phosphohydrolase/phosphomutase
MTTGKNPGKIGIFGFLRMRENGATSIVTSECQDSPAIWHILGEYGLHVGVLNVPATYPPSPVNGFMVTGLLTPSTRGYTFPPELASELDLQVNGYVIEPIPSRDEDLVTELERVLTKQLNAAKYLMSRRHWDFAMFVIRTLDIAQHHLWPVPGIGGSYKAIKSCYEMADKAVGTLSDQARDDAYLMVASDHGAAPLFLTFFANEWLIRQGLLSMKDRRVGLLDKVALRTLLKRMILDNIPVPIIRTVMNLMPSRLVEALTKVAITKESVNQLTSSVDWSKTWAFSLPGFSGIFINRRREHDPAAANIESDCERIREEICGKLRKIDRAGPFEVKFTVWKREEVYRGKHLGSAPDIVFKIQARQSQCEDYGECYVSGILGEGKVWGLPPTPGGHRSEGIWMIMGPGIKKIELGADIVDLMPTILRIFDVPIPNDLDGRVLSEVFQEEKAVKAVREHKRSVPQEQPPDSDHVPTTLSAAEEEEIADRLRRLGYLG